jgi:hypothetical protein
MFSDSCIFGVAPARWPVGQNHGMTPKHQIRKKSYQWPERRANPRCPKWVLLCTFGVFLWRWHFAFPYANSAYSISLEHVYCTSFLITSPSCSPSTPPLPHAHLTISGSPSPTPHLSIFPSTFSSLLFGVILSRWYVAFPYADCLFLWNMNMSRGCTNSQWNRVSPVSTVSLQN